MAEPRDGRRSLRSGPMLLWAWTPVALISLLHYATPSDYAWAHDIYRRLYYLPIVLGAFISGMRGGLLVAAVVGLAYAPHAFVHLEHLAHSDPARNLEKALELLLYGAVGAICGVLVDRERARQQQLRAALAEQQRTAEQLVRAGRLAALGELVAGIAHEVKNPLHALRGTAEVVDEVVPRDAPQRRLWELHLKELDRLQTVSERFLSFARPAPPQRRPVDLGAVAQRVRDLVAAEARTREVEVGVRGAERDAAARTVNADEQQLTQVLLNLCLNALQAIGDGTGRITLELVAETRGTQRYRGVRIANDGPRIAESDLERIFDPFFTTRGDGVGLGLSIAARIVEQHGGLIEVRNAPGDGPGVVFTVLLPEAKVS